MKTRSALNKNKCEDANEKDDKPDAKLVSRKRKNSNCSKSPKAKKNKQIANVSSDLNKEKFKSEPTEDKNYIFAQPKNATNEDVEKSDDSDWEEVGEDYGQGSKFVSDFDKNLIEKISNIAGEVESSSYHDIMSNPGAPQVKSLASLENDIKPSAIQINLRTGEGKGGKFELGLTEEEKRQQAAQVRHKLVIQRKLKQLERIHKAHLLCLLAHAYHVNRVCNEAPLRNLLVDMLSSDADRQNMGKKATNLTLNTESKEKRKSKNGGRGTKNSQNESLEDNEYCTVVVPRFENSLLYSSFSNKIDVAALIKWIRTTFSSQSFEDPKVEGSLASKNLYCRLMICAYKKVDPELLAKLPYPISPKCGLGGKKEKQSACRVGYLNLIAIALLRSLQIETRLVLNFVASPLKLPNHGRLKKENERKTDGKQNEKGSTKSSPKASSNVQSQQSVHPTVQYWLEARLDQGFATPSTSSEHVNMRWVTINCVKAVNPQDSTATSRKSDEETGEISRRNRTRAKSTTKETDTKSHAVLKVSPYFTASNARNRANYGHVEAPESVVKSLKLPKTIAYIIEMLAPLMPLSIDIDKNHYVVPPFFAFKLSLELYYEKREKPAVLTTLPLIIPTKSLTEKNHVRDLSVKYAPDWHINGRKLRIGFRSEEHGWWHSTLERLNAKISTEHQDHLSAGKKKGRKIKAAKVLKKEVEALEENEILAVSQKRPLPTTINEYKDHPLYVLKRHLLRNQAIYPADAKPVGYIRNEPVYLRENLHHLKARINWLKDDARLVRLDEKGYKLVLKRPSLKEFRRRKRLKEAAMAAQGLSLEGPSLSEKQNISEDGLENENEMKSSISSDPGGKEMEELFGIWQTDPYISPPVVNGKIPRNTFGNVELFQMSMLPVGTVYVSDMPALNKVASKIGMECVPAMRGWEFGRSGAHPILDGWVILEEDQERLLDEWDRFQVENQVLEFQKKEKRAVENWRKFTRALLIKERIQAKYGTKLEECSKATEKSAFRKKKGSKLQDDKETLSTTPSSSPWGESSIKSLANTVLDLASYESNAKS